MSSCLRLGLKDICRRGGIEAEKTKKGREEQKWGGDGWIDGERKDTWKTYLE